MSFNEFEHKARLYVVGALDEEETAEFLDARREFGAVGDELIRESQKLAAAFALSLRPQPVPPETKQRLLAMIREALHHS
jgi:hypothetical protein